MIRFSSNLKFISIVAFLVIFGIKSSKKTKIPLIAIVANPNPIDSDSAENSRVDYQYLRNRAETV